MMIIIINKCKAKYMKLGIVSTMFLLIFCGCSKEKQLTDSNRDYTSTSGVITENESTIINLNVSDIIEITRLNDVAITMISDEVDNVEQIESIKKYFLNSIKLVVEDIKDSFINFRVESDYADNLFKIPFEELQPLDKYVLELGKVDKEFGDPRLALSVTLVINEETTFTLGEIFIMTEDIEKETLQCYFVVPFDNQYEITEKGDQDLQTSLIESYSNMIDKTVYAGLIEFDSFNVGRFREGSPTVDNDGHDGFSYFNIEPITYEFENNCKIIYINRGENAYRVTSLKSLHSYAKLDCLSDVYLIGLKEGKIVYMFNIFYS